jgi:hypothetical protein
MIETLFSPPALLTDLTEAYATGDVTRGEQLLVQALDDDLPWNEVCAAAARGIARHYGEQAGG